MQVDSKPKYVKTKVRGERELGERERESERARARERERERERERTRIKSRKKVGRNEGKHQKVKN